MIRFILCFIYMAIVPMVMFGQDYLFDFEYKADEDDLMIPIINDKNDELVILLSNEKRISGYHFDNEYKVKWNFISDKPDKYDKCLMGAVNEAGEIAIYYSNKNFTGLSCINLDLNTKEPSPHIFDLKIKNEKYLSSETVEDKLYILSIVNLKSILKLYILDSKNEINIYTFDFGNHKFLDTTYDNTLYDLLDKENAGLQKISYDTPMAVEQTSNCNKVYFNEKEIILALDGSLNFTKLIHLDLEKFTSKIDTIGQNKILSEKLMPQRSNSFIYEEKIFQLNVSTIELALSIKDIKSKEILRQFIIKEEDSLFFKNTPVIQTGSNYGYSKKERELNKMSQVLRKVTRFGAGISVFSVDSLLEVTIGGSKNIQTSTGSSGMPITSGGGTIKGPYGNYSLPSYSYYSMPTYNYHSYTGSKSIYFKSALGIDSLNHLPIELEDNVFDKINDKLDEYLDRYFVELVFKMGKNYYLVYYFKPQKRHYLIKIS